jgi:tripartite-type tricarboxylate transporter receptor subunit TctC
MRNTLARMIGLVAWVLAGAVHAAGTGWPPENAAVQIIVPSDDTGINVAIARLVAEQLQIRLGGHFAVEAYPSSHAAGAASYVAAAPADGATLLLCDEALLDIANQPWRDSLAPVTQLPPIGLVAELPNVLVVNNDLPANDLTEFTVYVRHNPGVVNFGSNGNGSAMHLAGQLYMTQTDSNMVHVAYSASGQAMSNLISGQIQSMFNLAPVVLAKIKAHQIKALAVMSEHRLPALDQVPTAAEQGYPQLRAGLWLALLAPPDTPRDTIERTNKALNEALLDSEVERQLAQMGAIAAHSTPGEAADHIAAERKRRRALMAESDLPVR